MSKSDIVDLDAILQKETELARCFTFEEGGPEVWIPKSQHEWDESEWVVSLPEHVAIEKELV